MGTVKHECIDVDDKVKLFQVNAQYQEEPTSWTEATDQSAQSQYDSRENTDILSVKQEYYDGEDNIDVKL
jgi:hypothetical protein